MNCPRCCKLVLDVYAHTCKPTEGWRKMETEIAELKRQLEVHEANTARFIVADNSMQKQLVESQAREARLRDVLNEAESALDECRDYPITYDAVLEALALPHDDTALKEYLAKAKQEEKHNV